MMFEKIDWEVEMQKIGDAFVRGFQEGFAKSYVPFRETYLSTLSKDELERFYKKERNRKRYYRMMERKNARKK